MLVRLQKRLADAGFGSRREVERWIANHRISVNGAIATLGVKVDEKSIIRLDGKLLKLQKKDQVQESKILIYNKPEGQICARIDHKSSIFKYLPPVRGSRWISIGRLDINTSGLILFCTDGHLANKLMHPSLAFDREYSVRVSGIVTEEKIKNLKYGVELEDGYSRFSDVVKNDDLNHRVDLKPRFNNWFTVCMQTGRKNEVRRLMASQQLQVNRLKRVRYGPIFLPASVRRGGWEYLPKVTVDRLYELCE